jgi:nicotinamidase-related amidase
MNKTALIFMEFQNDFFTNGKLGMFREDADFVTNARKILESAREKGLFVVHVHLGCEGIKEDIDGILALVKKKTAFQANTDGAGTIDSMLPRGKELCFLKNSISAFERTNLEEVLRTEGIENVVFLGLISNVCMESSIRSAYDKGFRIVAIRDASSGLDEKGHEHAMNQTIPLFANVMDTSDFLQQ